MQELLKKKPVIFFDIGDTLVAPPSGDWMFINRFLELAGDRLQACSAEEIQRAKAAGLDYLAKNHLVLTETEEAEQFYRYYSIISDRLQLRLTHDELRAAALDRTYNMGNYRLYPDAIKVLETLSKTHRLGVISDTWPSIENQLRTLGVLQYFSFATYSFALGVFKPDPRMFLDALQKCGHDAKDTVFIDDNPKNLEGAAKLGITPILIAVKPGADVVSTYPTIHALSELL